MAERTVVWTQTAVTQRREILKYWAKRNGSLRYPQKLIKLIKRRVEVIARNPLAFIETTYPGTRVSALGHFSIFYKVTEQNLIITAFWDNRQDPKVLYEILTQQN